MAPTSITYELRDRSGVLVALHERFDEPGGEKRFVFRQPDGARGLAGFPSKDLPLFGIEHLTGAGSVVLTEGEKATQALLAAGVPAVGTVTGASGRRVPASWPN